MAAPEAQGKDNRRKRSFLCVFFVGQKEVKCVKYDSYEIGPVIRRMRKERNMTLEVLSEKTGLSESTLNKIEIGNRNMSIQTLYALMTAFDCDANSILLSEYQKKSSVDVAIKLLPKDMWDSVREIFLRTIIFLKNMEETK